MAAALPDVAIVIGVARYPRLGPRGAPKDLLGPVRDAEAVAAWLSAQTARTTHVTLVTSDGSGDQSWTVQDLRPQSHDVEQPLNDLVDKGVDLRNDGRPVRLGRRLTIYMAGHGFLPERKHLALVTADASLGRVNSILATSWADWFADQTHFDEIVLWMDCCTIADYSQPSRGPIGVALSTRVGEPVRLVTAWAARPDQSAYERAGEDGSVRGIFTVELLKGLSGAAAGPDGRVTTATLMRYFEGMGGAAATPSGETRTENLLKPYFRDHDEIEFARVARPPLYRIHTGLGPDVAVRVFRNGEDLYFDGSTGPGGVVEAELPFGIYALRAGQVSKLFEIAAGNEADVHPR
jgi:hypothetical protein